MMLAGCTAEMMVIIINLLWTHHFITVHLMLSSGIGRQRLRITQTPEGLWLSKQVAPALPTKVIMNQLKIRQQGNRAEGITQKYKSTHDRAQQKALDLQEFITGQHACLDHLDNGRKWKPRSLFPCSHFHTQDNQIFIHSSNQVCGFVFEKALLAWPDTFGHRWCRVSLFSFQSVISPQPFELVSAWSAWLKEQIAGVWKCRGHLISRVTTHCVSYSEQCYYQLPLQ